MNDLNPDNARIYGGDADAVHLAPLGTLLPTTIDEELAPAFEDVGWLHTDGVTETATGSAEKKRGHQGNGVIRTKVSEGGTTIAFTALETKAMTQRLRYDEKSTEVAGGVRQTRRGPGQKITRVAAVLDFFDEDNDSVQERWVIETFEVIPTGDRTMTNADIAGYPMSGEIIGEYDHFTTAAEGDEEDPEVP
ncbi:hypothetical protein [Microbacterium halotolerans]|uniref:phage tail tube protein n=1 Tax=Microbacterium halotolerans TaxID=246613 RepID=UPI000E6AA155|nr:hypothetical protein [Microbacterium halotolerans]